MNLPIRIAAAVICDTNGRVLLVRKRGTKFFMQPGGKIAPNEDALAALSRELHEELGCCIRPATARFLGQFTAAAANEVGGTVVADLYAVALDGDVRPSAEIEEAAWVDATAPGEFLLAPLTRDSILPLLTDASWVETQVGHAARSNRQKDC
jgi:8-oxo-dGTP diphosphatase